METKISNTGRYLLLLLGQIVLIALCIGYIFYVYYRDIYPDKMVRQRFNETQCEISSKQIPLSVP